MKSIKFTIITHVAHVHDKNEYLAYAPYVQEMNIWFKYVDEVIIVAPLKCELTGIDFPYKHSKIDFRKVPDFNLTTFGNILSSVFKLPSIIWKIFRAMQNADHIHLRCPGNMGLIGCFVQIFFPRKTKTAKYAGNWDPKSAQPWTYKLQKYILNNTFLTRNMQVLVYGEWNGNSANIKPFFTATYSDSEKENIQKDSLDSGVKFIFVGSLVSGKNPMYAVKLIQKLLEEGNNVSLNLYGEGSERNSLENYIQTNKLENHIVLKGNNNKEILKEAYKKSQFVILPSKSEGWPKAIAEGMFWGSVPLATKVSCVPFMLDYGKRGILLEMDLEKDFQTIQGLLLNQEDFSAKSNAALNWSQKYTTDIFEAEIKNLLSK